MTQPQRGRPDLRLVEGRTEPFNQFDARQMPGNLRLAARCVAGELVAQPHEKGLIARLRQLADEIERGTVRLTPDTPDGKDQS